RASYRFGLLGHRTSLPGVSAQAAVGRRSVTSAHAVQVLAGMRPTRIRPAKIAHPTQNAKTDSSVAAITIMPSRATATQSARKPKWATTAADDIVAPRACAKRLGGPGTGRGRPRRGATSRVASWPSGLNVGPVSTRARNPYASGTVSHSQAN